MINEIEFWLWQDYDVWMALELIQLEIDNCQLISENIVMDPPVEVELKVIQYLDWVMGLNLGPWP